jgi:hypothetical protein
MTKLILFVVRIEGIFPHHVKEWKQQFITGSVMSSESKKQVTVRGHALALSACS